MPRILLIEDEDSIRHLISYDLKTPGLTLPAAQTVPAPGKRG